MVNKKKKSIENNMRTCLLNAKSLHNKKGSEYEKWKVCFIVGMRAYLDKLESEK